MISEERGTISHEDTGQKVCCFLVAKVKGENGVAKKNLMIILSLLLIIPIVTPSFASGKDVETEQDQELWSAVKPLDTITSFMNTGAHPDDERSHLLAYLSRGLGVHTSSIIANRGEGGQNEIGEELGNGLGMIRSRELIEASKVTGVRVFHLSETTSDDIYDFGFSKSPEETLEKWGEGATYERFIRKIREYRPDIVMPSFRNVESQHGHHRAMTLLSLRAFEDAADPTVFSEQIEEGLKPWQIKKLYLPAESKETATVGIEVGEFDPIYGMTYPQLGEKSRYLHKSQGMGRQIEPGSQIEYLELEKSAVGEIPDKEDSIFEGLSFDFNEYAMKLKKGDNKIKGQLLKLQQDLEEVIQAYPTHKAVLKKSHEALKQLRQTKQKVESFSFRQMDKDDLLYRLDVKEEQLQEASKISSRLDVTTSVEKPVLTQGKTTNVTVGMENNGKEQINSLDVHLNVPDNWTVEGHSKSRTLDPGEEILMQYKVKVPEDEEYYQPYEKEVLSADISYKVGKEEAAFQDFPDETVAVLPEVGLKADPESLVVNTAQPREKKNVDVKVTNYTHTDLVADVSLQLPEGWEEVGSKSVSFKENETEKVISFLVTPPKEVADEHFEITPTAKVSGKELNTSVQEISYDHIGTFYYLEKAAVEGAAFDLKFPENLKVGYIESGFDMVADKLAEAGMNVRKIEDLATEDLSHYDTVVIGIRAYLSRADLVKYNAKLLEYAENGGHVVVQYNKPEDNWDSQTTAPYPITIGSPSIEWRVTDEASNYNILKPAHPLFNAPNKITESDWDGWVQERGLYFPMEWASQYETLLSLTDIDGDQFDGGILFAEHGKGSYVYTNLVWYRQIQNQVPGGYHVFTNLISFPKVN